MADSDKKKAYCGAKAKAPKGRPFGTEDECKKTGQLRRHGRFRASEQALAPKPKTKKALRFLLISTLEL